MLMLFVRIIDAPHDTIYWSMLLVDLVLTHVKSELPITANH